MGGELLILRGPCITTLSTDHLPKILACEGWRQMYASDVAAELQAVVDKAVMDWYERRGHALLACEPG